MPDVIIVVQGGVVQEVYTSEKNIDVTLIDFDNHYYGCPIAISKGGYPTEEMKDKWFDVVCDIVGDLDIEVVDPEVQSWEEETSCQPD